MSKKNELHESQKAGNCGIIIDHYDESVEIKLIGQIFYWHLKHKWMAFKNECQNICAELMIYCQDLQVRVSHSYGPTPEQRHKFCFALVWDLNCSGHNFQEASQLPFLLIKTCESNC